METAKNFCKSSGRRFGLLLAALTLALAACNPSEVASPDGRTRLRFALDEAGTPRYWLDFNGEPIVDASALGLVTETDDFTRELRLVGTTSDRHDETWEPLYGQFDRIANNYRRLTATLENAAGRRLQIEFRVFDDGAGFRYLLEGEGSCGVTGERSEFRMASDNDTHWIAASHDDDEFIYQHTPLSGITHELCLASAPSSHHRALLDVGVNTPVTMKTPAGNYVAIHEAALWHYPAMSLAFDPATRTFTSSLAGLSEVKAAVELPFATPWRTITVGDRAGALVESSLVLNLNDPCRLEETSG